MSTNIGRSNDDSSFRYKMPKLLTKVEGRGNGIKTVIVNMVDVAKALHVQPQYPTKFFGIELGAQSKFEKDTDRAIVNGAHSAGDLQRLLDKYIAIFVLCPKCKLPEIKIEVLKSKIKIDCAACGYNDVLKTAHKLASFIIKNPPTKKEKEDMEKDDVEKEAAVKSKSRKKEDKADKKKGKKKKKDGSSDEDSSDEAVEAVVPTKKPSEKDEEKVEWFTDTSKEAQRARQQAEFAEIQRVDEALKIVEDISKPADKSGKDSPSTVLRMYLASGGRSPAEVTAELRRLQLARGLDESQRLKTLFEAVFDVSQPQTIVSQFKKQAPLLKKFAADKAGVKLMIGCLEDFVANVNPKLVPYIPHILQTLYENDVLSEESILSWADSPPESSWFAINKDLAANIRVKAKPFISWLRTAEDAE